MRKSALLLAATVLLLSLSPFPSVSQASAPELPGIIHGLQPCPASNVSMNKPAVAFPGDTVYIALKPDYASAQVSGGYMYSVKLEGGRLRLLNYTVPASSSGGVVALKVPPDAEGGVYDLVLYGAGQRLYLPKSVWVLSAVSDVLKIVHVSDQHYGAGTPNIMTGDKNRFSAYLAIGLIDPDVVIDTGDIADTASALQYQAAAAFEYALLYKYPILSNPGNHDVPNDQYVAYFGDTQWYRLIGGRVLVVAVNTREEGYLKWDQLVFLESVLKQYKDVPVKILLMHHPMFYYQGELVTSSDDTATLRPYASGGPWTPVSSYWSGNMTSFFYTLRLIEDYNVTYVLAGHVHRDLFVKYTSTRTNTTTYFLTITTLAHGSAIYDGLDVYALDTRTGDLSFPLTPPTFIGFSNITGELRNKYKPNLAMNSFPIGVYPATNNYGQSNLTFFPAELIQTPHAYIVKAYNRLGFANFSNVVLWALPWSGDFQLRVLRAEGGASVSVVDRLFAEGRLFVALNITLPSGSGVEFALANAPDAEPPSAAIKLTVPKVPTLGRSLTIYLAVSDKGWGPRGAKAVISIGGQAQELQLALDSPGTLVNPIDTLTYGVTIQAPPGSEPASAILNVTAYDWAGNSATYTFKINFVPPGQTPATPIETLTTTTTTTMTSTPATASATTTTTSAPTSSPTTAATTPSPQQAPSQPGLSPALVAAVVVAVAVVLVAAMLARRR